MKNVTKTILFTIIFCFFSVVLCVICKPEIKCTEYNTETFELYSIDQLLDGDRQSGYVNLQKFIELASNQSEIVFDSISNISRKRDSITFSISIPSVFFGIDGGEWWKTKYKNLPISFPDSHSFTACVKEIDGMEFINIPYQILSCLASSYNIHQTNIMRTTSLNDTTITIANQNELDKLAHDGSKIQTGGRVFEHVSDVLLHQGGQGKSQEEQLKILWTYAYNNWMYLPDPYTGVDTWRSATETINAYYFAQQKGYSGDCDDFAILMASFARQIGFDSHVVAALGNNGGHAYAEYFNGLRWIPMDWFCDKFGGTPYTASKKVILTDI